LLQVDEAIKAAYGLARGVTDVPTSSRPGLLASEEPVCIE
jgi:hypothetical protein